MILQLQFRRGVPADAETIVEFNAQLAQETEHRALDRVLLRHGVDEVLADAAKGLYWLAEAKNQIVGQLMVTLEWSDWRNGWFWWVQSVYVRPEWRGRGVFSELYAFVEQQATECPDVCGLRLYVEKNNAAARRTYERLGMKPTNYLVFETDFRSSEPPRVTPLVSPTESRRARN